MNRPVEPDSAIAMSLLARAMLAVNRSECRTVRSAAEREAWAFAIMSFMKNQRRQFARLRRPF